LFLSQPHFEGVWGWHSHSRNGDLAKIQSLIAGVKTPHLEVIYVIGKVLKCRCQKWPHMSHSDICSTSYGWKKGWESNWQFDSQPLKAGNLPDPGVFRSNATVGKLSRRATSLIQTSSRSKVWARNYELPKSRESKPGQFRDSSLGVPRKNVIWM
jgi:hypothetical protein